MFKSSGKNKARQGSVFGSDPEGWIRVREVAVEVGSAFRRIPNSQ